MTHEHTTEILDVLQDIQEAQVEAGGRFIRTSELENMTLGELLKMLIPNNVEFKIKYHRK